MKSLSLVFTPKIFKEPRDYERDAKAFLEHYRPFCEGFDEVLLMFCVGNGEQMLLYPGPDAHGTEIAWARYSGYTFPYIGKERTIESSLRLSYSTVHDLVRILREIASDVGMPEVRIFDMIDPGTEFCESEFRQRRHPEVMWMDDPRREPQQGIRAWTWVDISARLRKDESKYAAFPNGIQEGLPFADFCVFQVGSYLEAMELDGVMLLNAYGTTGQWEPRFAQGWGAGIDRHKEQDILAFFRSLKLELGERKVYWWDTYWPVEYEWGAWSVNEECYSLMDYLQVCAHKVIIPAHIARENLKSKVELGHPRLMLTVDTADPWYRDAAWYEQKPSALEDGLALVGDFKAKIAGIQIFASTADGNPIPTDVLDRIRKACD